MLSSFYAVFMALSLACAPLLPASDTQKTNVAYAAETDVPVVSLSETACPYHEDCPSYPDCTPALDGSGYRRGQGDGESCPGLGQGGRQHRGRNAQ